MEHIRRSQGSTGPAKPGAVLYSLEGDFGFSPPNATSPAPEIGHEVKLINFNQLPDTPLSLQIQNFARNPPGMPQGFVFPNLNGFNRPTNLRFGPDGCAYVVDYGVVRDAGADHMLSVSAMVRSSGFPAQAWSGRFAHHRKACET